MSTPKKKDRTTADPYADDADYWIDVEYGPPSLATLSARIAAFRENPHRRSAHVTGSHLERELRKHDPAAWPPDIVAYLLDDLARRLPTPIGREPVNAALAEGHAFMFDQYRELKEELAALDENARDAWCKAKAIERGTVSEMAIEAVRKEFCPHLGTGRLRNIFSQTAQSQKRE